VGSAKTVLGLFLSSVARIGALCAPPESAGADLSNSGFDPQPRAIENAELNFRRRSFPVSMSRSPVRLEVDFLLAVAFDVGNGRPPLHVPEIGLNDALGGFHI
jgi:hypothetical protein